MDELAFVTDYLEIEAARFEDRLRWVVDIPGELRANVVPAFSVQTLVENAVKHGACRREGASLHVGASRLGDRDAGQPRFRRRARGLRGRRAVVRLTDAERTELPVARDRLRAFKTRLGT